MHSSPRNRLLLAGAWLALGTLGFPGLHASPLEAQRATPPAAQPDNFGFQLGFSPTKMDRGVDPRKNFYHYAAGNWLAVAKVPSDGLRVSGVDLMAKQVEFQLRSLLLDTAQTSVGAKPGSPLQQVGDFYASGVDAARRSSLGFSPLQQEWDRIGMAIDKPSLAAAIARLELITNDPVLIGMGVDTDPKNRNRYVLFLTDSKLPLSSLDYYLKPENEKIRSGYRQMIVDYLVLAGLSQPQAQARAAKILEIETRVASKKLTPLQKQDPAKVFKSMSFAEAGAMLTNFDLETFAKTLGLPTEGPVVVTEMEALKERNALLASSSLEDTKAYLQWELLRKLSPYLSPAFTDAQMTFSRILFGPIDTPKPDKLVAEVITSKLGHPLSQLYVGKYFSDDTKKAAESLVGRIMAEFRSRLVRNTWLSAESRAYAIKKLDRMKIAVGYPDKWIDASSVEIRRDDYLGNVIRLNEFSARRDLDRVGKPVIEDEFADPRSTLPVIVNAGYNEARNGIEIPAAFLQPPFYDPKADAAVNYCTLGAVIGHEITHGFDSQGRLYDADGNVRNWWTEADSKAFVTQASKLVRQADAYEVLPGVRLNGQLSIGENLADVGGVSLAHAALQGYLRDQPGEDRLIAGFTPSQRCFLAWAQNWAEKTNPGYLKQAAATDPHPPGSYRTTAPSQHEASFFEAFNIRAGDPMWLPENDRVRIW